MERYDKNDEREWLADKVIGGAEQLAHSLSERMKADPQRLARLALQFPADANPHYFSAVASGLYGAKLPFDLLLDVVKFLHNRPGRPHGRWIPGMIATNREHDLPGELLEAVTWYATEDKDPEADIWRSGNEAGPKMYGGNPRFHGINTVRGSAAGAISRLITADRIYWDFFQRAAEALVSDRTISVRSCAAEICSQGLRYDRKRAIALFLRLIDTEDAILAIHPVEEFVHYTGLHDWPAMSPVLQRMMASSEDGAREAGARQATLIALSEEEANTLAECALAGDAVMRKGVADVLSHNVLRHYQICAPRLAPLFDDPDEKVRQAADDWIHPIADRGTLETLLPLAEAYLSSRAYAEHPDTFFRMLETIVDAPPALLFKAAQRFMDCAGKEAGDIRTRHAMTGDRVGKLLLRAYRQADADRDLRAQCLDLFDRLLASGTHGAERALDSWGRN